MRAARRRPRRSPPDAAEPIPVREMPMSSFPLLSPMPIVPPESTRDGPAAAGPSFARLFLTEARRIAVLWTRYPLELLGGLLLLAFLFMVFAAIGSVTQGPFAVFAGNRTAMAMLYVLWTIVSTTVGAGASQVGADAAAGVLENLFLAAAPVERVLQARCVALLAQGCAIGLALCFGFEFPDNFRYPYAARGFSDFWRRWHITLSTWLRDYLYIPLGGSAEGRAKTYRNLMLTMLLGGLWHGASWMFVAWGGLHGAYLAIERALRGPRARGSTPTSGGVALPLATFLVVTLTWIPFRAPDAATAGQMLAALFRFGAANTVAPTPMLLAYATMLATLAWQHRQRDRSLEQWFGGLGRAGQVGALAACLIALFLCSGGDERAFIYFQF